MARSRHDRHNKSTSVIVTGITSMLVVAEHCAAHLYCAKSKLAASPQKQIKTLVSNTPITTGAC